MRPRLARLARSDALGTLIAISVALTYALLTSRVAPGEGLAVWAVAAFLVVRVGAAVVALAAARRPEASALAPFFRYWGLTLGFWALADAAYRLAWYSTGKSLPVPSLVDLLRLAGGFALIAALTRQPSGPWERFGRVRRFLDSAILAVAITALAWLVFVRPAVQVGFAPNLHVLWSAVGPVTDLIGLVLLLRLVLLPPEGRPLLPFNTMAAALALQAGYDFVDRYALLQGEWAPAGGGEALGLASSLLLIHVFLRRLPAARSRPSRRGAAIVRRLEPLLAIALTYAVAGSTAVDMWLSGNADWVGVGASAFLGLMLIARQGVLAGQAEMRQFQALVDASADAAFICTLEGEVLLANPALRRMLGTAEDVPSELHLEPHLEADVGLGELLQAAAAQGWQGEVSLVDAGGARYPIALSLRPIRDDRRGGLLLAGTGHDLTQVKQREAELRRALHEVAEARRELEALNQQLEAKVETRTLELQQTVADLARLNEELKELDRLKTEFIALVSHELRAPLTNIRGGIELVLEAYPDLAPQARDTLTLVQAETERLGGFVEAILDLSALEAGRFPLHLEPIDLPAVVRTVISRFPKDGDVDRLRAELPPGLPPVRADERALSSVLFHLVDNALKYAPLSEVRVTAEVVGEGMRIAVHDRGPGIPPEERERIFEMFHRLDASDAREVYGHGLGLHLSRRLVEAMGGHIHIEDEEPGGTQVVFWLPLCDR